MFERPLYFCNVTVFDASGPIGDSLRVQGKYIIAINTSPQRKDRVIDGQGGLLIPALINAHDHLELNTFKRLKYRKQYTHSVQWIEDIEARFDSDPDLIKPRQQALAERLLIGALKNLLSGVTTVCHHNPLHKALWHHYPVQVVKEYGFSHSLFRAGDPHLAYHKTKADWPWIIHLAEGVDELAAAEFDRLDKMGLVHKNTVLVHGVGLTSAQQQALLKRGGGLIWCPGSNLFMFGQTASVQTLSRANKLALGSDSRLSGEFDLLHELRVAAKTEQLSTQALFQAVTTDAADLLRLRRGGKGQITVGGIADLLLLPSPLLPDMFLHLFTLHRSQLMLVMLAGKPLVGALAMQPVFEATRTKFCPVQVDQVEKLMPRKFVKRLLKSSLSEPGLKIL